MTHKKYTSVEVNKFKEGQALEVLKFLFPHKYQDAILSDAPDIINEKEDIGVEITSCIIGDVQKGISKVGDFSGKNVADLTERNRKQMQFENVHIKKSPTNKIFGTFSHWGQTHDPTRAYFNKKERLNAQHFKVFGENNLLITAWMIDEDDLEFAILFFQTLGTHNKYNELEKEKDFDYIYIFKDELLVEINIAKAEVNKHVITPEQMDIFSNNALIVVEKNK